jgi:hypothetical protein
MRIEDCWGATLRGGAGGRLGKRSRLARLAASSSLRAGDNLDSVDRRVASIDVFACRVIALSSTTASNRG